MGAGALVTLACAGPVLITGSDGETKAEEATEANRPVIKGDLVILVQTDGNLVAFAKAKGPDMDPTAFGKEAQQGHLRSYLEALAAEDPDREIVIEAGLGVVSQDIVPTVDAVLYAGFTDVQLRSVGNDPHGSMETMDLDPTSDFFVGSGEGSNGIDTTVLGALGYVDDGADFEDALVHLSRVGYVDDGEDAIEVLSALGYLEVAARKLEADTLPTASLTIVIGDDHWARIGDAVLLPPDQRTSPEALEVLQQATASFDRVPIIEGLPMTGINEVVRIQASAGVPFERVQRVLMLCSNVSVLAWNLQLDLAMENGSNLLIACPLPRDLDEAFEEVMEDDQPAVPRPIREVALYFQDGQVNCIGPAQQFQADPMRLDAAQLATLKAMGAAVVAGQEAKFIKVEVDGVTESATIAQVLQHFTQAGDLGRILFVGAN